MSFTSDVFHLEDEGNRCVSKLQKSAVKRVCGSALQVLLRWSFRLAEPDLNAPQFQPQRVPSFSSNTGLRLLLRFLHWQ